MDIWLLTIEYPPYSGGGIATYCYHTGRMLSSKHNVTIFVADDSLSQGLQTSTNGRLRVVRFKPGQRDIYRYMGYIAALSYEFSELIEEFVAKEGQPDIIECHDYLGIAYFLLQKKRTHFKCFSDIPIVLSLHGPKFLCDRFDQAPTYKFPNFWIGEMERFCLRAADFIISPSKYLINMLKKYITLDVPYCIVPNPYDCPPIFSQNKTSPWEVKDLVFLGRMQYLKGILHLLKYLRELWEEGFNIPLSIIGGDTIFHPANQLMSNYIREKYQKYIKKGLIKIEGLLAQKNLHKRLEKATIVIIPSLFETFPYSVVEPMAIGKVVIASDTGGQTEIIEDGISGFLCSHNQPESFKSLLLQLFNHMEILTHVGEAAKARIQELCSYEKVYVRKMEALESAKNVKKSRIFPFIRPRPKKYVNTSQNDEIKGLLSVIIPYFNMGSYISETINSVFNSTYKNIEVIVVDDGSNDPHSIEILNVLQQQYPIKIHHQVNQGLPMARNNGAQIAKGEFIAFLDADDKVEPEYFEWAIQLLEYYTNISFVGCWTKYFGSKEGLWPTWNCEPPYLLLHNMINSSSIVARKKDFLTYGLNDPAMEYGMEDYESVLRMVENGCMGISIPKPLFMYRVRSDSMSRFFNPKNILYLYAIMSEKHNTLYKEFAVEIFNLINNNGPSFLYENPTHELPPVYFISNCSPKLSYDYCIPFDLKRKLLKLWQIKWFRVIMKAFSKLPF